MRVSSLLRTFVCVVAVSVSGLCSVAATFTVDNIIYDVNDYDCATIVGYTPGLGASVTIPYVVNYKSDDGELMFFVNAIADGAFADSGITEIIFAAKPYSVPDKYDDLTIGKGAFDVASLKTIIVNRPNVPLVGEDVEVFNPAVYESAELVLGDGLTRSEVEAYDATYPWNKFQRRMATGIVGLQRSGALRVAASDGIMEIECDGRVVVCDVGGNLVYSGDGSVTLTRGHGIYIVSTQFERRKVEM